MALVLNPKTGLVSPQFHVVFDDDFSTVPHLRKGTVPPNWEKLVSGSGERSTDEFFDLQHTWFEPISYKTAGENLEPDDPIEKDLNSHGSPDNEGDFANEGASHRI